jgi:hypothetical protein
MKKLDKILSGHVYNLVGQSLTQSPYNYLEIGVFNGVGFSAIAKHFQNKKCYAVDPFIEDGHTVDCSNVNTGEAMAPQKTSALMYVSECPNASIEIVTSHQFLEELTTEKIKHLNIGVVLIDGNHNYDFVVNDYELALRVIDNKEGYIIFDDADKPDVAQAFNEFYAIHESRIIETDAIHTGLLVKLKAL